MMQFDWTTFILEILNFLVLLWILQRFLYRPVLSILDSRQQRIKDATEHAEQLRSEAEQLRHQFELRLADWQQQQQAEQRKLDEELAQLKNSALEALKQSLAEEEAKLRMRNQTLIAAHEAALISEAAAKSYGQASALLQRLATPALTNRIVDVFLEDLQSLSQTDHVAVQKAAAQPNAAAVEVISAHLLEQAERAKLIQAVSMATGITLQFVFKEDPGLIAGVRVVFGECQLHANLLDELAFFRRQTVHG